MGTNLKVRTGATLSLSLISTVLLSLALLACAGHTTSGVSASPTKMSAVTATSSPTGDAAHNVAANTLSALARIRSFQMDTDVTGDIGTTAATTIDRWTGTKVVDIADRRIHMTMTIDVTGSTSDQFSLEMYFANGEEYVKSSSQHSSGGNQWQMEALTNEIWASESQVGYYQGLLTSPSGVSLGPNEMVNGVNCFVLSLTPSTNAMIDWVSSQQQPTGPRFAGPMPGGMVSVVRPDAYQGGSAKVWIDTATYLPVKADMEAGFRGPTGGGIITVSPGTAYTPTGAPVTAQFHGQVMFSGYNQPVSIQLPAAAAGAQQQ
jgi:hypothetical protein